MKSATSLMKNVFSLFGIHISRIPTSKKCEWDRLSLLQSVNTVIDVGIGDKGSPFLYSYFPNARFISIDALIECKQVVERALADSTEQNLFIHTALGSSAGHIDINVSRKLSRSSVLERTSIPDQSYDITERRRVRLETLDAVTASLDLKSGILIKIDVEGFELEVLKGSTELLAKTKYVMIEAPSSKNFQCSYTFLELAIFMKELSFDYFLIVKSDIPHFDVCFFKGDRPGMTKGGM